MKTILFLGDSLTEWNDWGRRFSGFRVHNLGRAGESVEGLLSRVPGTVARHPTADMVFVMSGINNLAMGYADFLGSYRAIVRRLAGAYPTARIFVQGILPVAGDWVAPGTIREVNERLGEIAGECGAQYLDTHAVFLDDGGRLKRAFLEPDGVHVSPEGYRAWEGFLAPIVEGGG